MGSDESVYGNFVLLTNPVGPGGGLDIILGVPVGVKDDNLGSNDEVDAYPSSFGRNKEEIGLLLSESGYGLVSLYGGLTSCE